MFKRDFEALANALAKQRPNGISLPLGDRTCDPAVFWHCEGWVACVEAVANVCAASNPRFDRERFVRACEER